MWHSGRLFACPLPSSTFRTRSSNEASRHVASAVVSPTALFHRSSPSSLGACLTRLVHVRVRAACSSGPQGCVTMACYNSGVLVDVVLTMSFFFVLTYSSIIALPSFIILDWPSCVYLRVCAFSYARCSPRLSAPRSSNSTPITLPRSCAFDLLPIMGCASTICVPRHNLPDAHPPFHHLRTRDLLPFFLEFCTVCLTCDMFHYPGCLSALWRISFSAHRSLCRPATPLSTEYLISFHDLIILCSSLVWHLNCLLTLRVCLCLLPAPSSSSFLRATIYIANTQTPFYHAFIFRASSASWNPHIPFSPSHMFILFPL